MSKDKRSNTFSPPPGARKTEKSRLWKTVSNQVWRNGGLGDVLSMFAHPTSSKCRFLLLLSIFPPYSCSLPCIFIFRSVSSSPSFPSFHLFSDLIFLSISYFSPSRLSPPLANPSHFPPQHLSPEFFRLAPPLHIAEDELAWLLPLEASTEAAPSPIAGLHRPAWDPSMCQGTSVGSEVRRLMTKAFKVILFQYWRHTMATIFNLFFPCFRCWRLDVLVRCLFVLFFVVFVWWLFCCRTLAHSLSAIPMIL